MSDTPPPQQFAAYPRGPQQQHGSPEKLEALAEGYSGICKVFYIYLLVMIAVRVIAMLVNPSIFLLALVVVIVAMGFTGKYVALVGQAMDWSSGKIVTARILMALNYFCCGLLGFAIFQSIAAQELKRYGIKIGFLGIDRAEVDRALASMR